MFNNTLEPFNTPLKTLFKNTNIVGESTINLLVERFEVRDIITDRQFTLVGEGSEILNAVNTFFSQFSSVNGRIRALQRLILIRLFLIKTFRGRSHALGKPSRGQRT